jgi:hypothetical protein
MSKTKLADEIEKLSRLDAQAGVGALCARHAGLIVAALRGSAEPAGLLGRENDAFHRALRKYPNAFEAMHSSFWNYAFAAPPSPDIRRPGGGGVRESQS